MHMEFCPHCSIISKHLSNVTNGVSASEGNVCKLQGTGPSLTSAPICLIGVVVTRQQSCKVGDGVGWGRLSDNAVIMEISWLRGPGTKGST